MGEQIGSCAVSKKDFDSLLSRLEDMVSTNTAGLNGMEERLFGPMPETADKPKMANGGYKGLLEMIIGRVEQNNSTLDRIATAV